jgi:cell division septation protein DedD
MSRFFSRRLMGSLALAVLLLPAVAVFGCKADVDDDGASVDVPPAADND